VHYPVVLIGFNRPDLIIRRLEEILPQLGANDLLYVYIDGPRDLEDSTWNSQIREIQNKYSDQSNVEFVFRGGNLGCSGNIISAVTEVCRHNAGAIIIEDDVSISPHFLSAISGVLNSWSPSSDWLTVGGFSPFVSHSKLAGRVMSSWRKSEYFSAWGWGVTSQAWDTFAIVSDQNLLAKALSASEKWKSLGDRKQGIWLKRFERGIWDFQVQIMHFAADKYCILPTLRIIDNEGFDSERSTHTRHKRPWNFFGFGYSAVTPTLPNHFSNKNSGNFWRFLDANLWAADGLMNARARDAGLRTYLKRLINWIK
jgi:hypothetical protein